MDEILWSDKMEEDYLQAMIEERRKEMGVHADNTSLSGDSVLGNLLAQSDRNALEWAARRGPSVSDFGDTDFDDYPASDFSVDDVEGGIAGQRLAFSSQDAHSIASSVTGIEVVDANSDTAYKTPPRTGQGHSFGAAATTPITILGLSSDSDSQSSTDQKKGAAVAAKGKGVDGGATGFWGNAIREPMVRRLLYGALFLFCIFIAVAVVAAVRIVERNNSNNNSSASNEADALDDFSPFPVRSPNELPTPSAPVEAPVVAPSLPAPVVTPTDAPLVSTDSPTGTLQTSMPTITQPTNPVDSTPSPTTAPIAATLSPTVMATTLSPTSLPTSAPIALEVTDAPSATPSFSPSVQRFPTSVPTSHQNPECQLNEELPFNAPAMSFCGFNELSASQEGQCSNGLVGAQFLNAAQREVCSGSECSIAYTQPGEYLEFPFLTNQPDENLWIAATTSSFFQRNFRLELVDEGLQSPVLVSPGNGWNTFERSPLWQVAVPTAGMHTVRITFLQGGVNFCSISVEDQEPVPPTHAPTVAPLTGSPTRIGIGPDCELFDQLPFVAPAMSFCGYYEYSPVLEGSCNNGIVGALDVPPNQQGTCGSDCAVGWTAEGEYLEYQFLTYQPNQGLRIATRMSANFPRTFRLELVNDGLISPEYESGRAGFSTYQQTPYWDVVVPDTGFHILRVVFVEGRSNLCSVVVEEL